MPRAIWAGKPAVNAGPRFAREAYLNNNTGIPPGGITELVWNFGRIGLTAAGIFGLAFGRADRWFRQRLGNGHIPYAAVFVSAPTSFVGAGFSQATSGIFLQLAVSFVVLSLAGMRIRKARGVEA